MVQVQVEVQTETTQFPDNNDNSQSLLSSDLDTSWIEKEEQLHSSENELPKLTMDSVLCYFIYISNDRSIQKIIKEREILFPINNRGDIGISGSRLLQMIQTRRFLGNGLKYKIIGLLKFFVELDSDSLSGYSRGEISDEGFFKEISFLEAVVFPPSIFIFHSLNSLYFVFKEDDGVKKNVKSILKTSSDTSSRVTKKVRISESLIPENSDPNTNVRKYKSLKNKPNLSKKTRKLLDKSGGVVLDVSTK